MTQPHPIPARLHAIIEEFQTSDRQEKLELMLDYADRLPPLPEHLREHTGMEQVHECMSPVFVTGALHDGRVVLHLAVPPEAPTTRGYAAILCEGLRDLTPQEILAVPGDFFYAMGLHEILSPQRLNGIAAILAYIKRLTLRLSRVEANGFTGVP